MTFKEISTELNINESTLKSSFYRTLKDLKKHFNGGVFIEQ